MREVTCHCPDGGSWDIAGGLPNAEYYNASGRALPDVSALSTNFEVVIQGLWGPISGTSAAAPTFAAIVTLLNDARYQAGKGPLGFLNPFLYQVRLWHRPTVCSVILLTVCVCIERRWDASDMT
jgi:subtilase family serine protease